MNAIEARLDRVEQHIEELQTAIRDFERLYPKIGGVALSQADPRQVQLSLRRREEPPPMLSVIAGEALYLLRSTLDQLVGQLLIATAGTAAARLLEHSYFLICCDDPSMDGRKHTHKHSSYWGTLPGVSGRTREIIEGCQPCKASAIDLRRSHPLALLERLNNRDKHRQLIGLGSLGSVETIKLGRGLGGSVLHIRADAVAGTSNDGVAEVARLIMPRTQPVDMEFEGSLQIAFKDVGDGKPEAVTPLLERLVKHVRGIVSDLWNGCPEFTGHASHGS